MVREKTLLFVLTAFLLATVSASFAQRTDPTRRIGVLLYLKENDPEGQTYLTAFREGLQKAGWIVGRNLEIEYRWTGGDPRLARKYAAELVALNPQVILTAGGNQVGPLQQVTRSIPIVFVQVADAVGAGLVNSLAKPGGNATGFTNGQFDISAKWLEVLTQISPSMKRVAVLRDAANPSGTGQFGAVQAVAPSFGVEASPIGLHDTAEIEHGLTAFAQQSNGGVMVMPNGLAIVHRAFIIAQATRLRLPAIYPFRYFVTDGGLISYGPDVVDQYRRAAGYVDRVLKGEKPAELPVQQSAKIDLAINLKAAQQIGLTVPPHLLARADRVIR
jgi:putative tryptophan/tyrosine transport system substrate-binding protein